MSLQAQPDFRRSCISLNNSDVSIQWIRPADPCNKFSKISIYGRLNSLSPYALIDEITQINVSQYTHIGAANLGNTWQYYLVYEYLCDDQVFYSDTIRIDLKQPDPTEIDSVSYDPLSGKYIIGWQGNKAIDLQGYTLWQTNGSSNIVLGNTPDTFYTDNTSDPTNGNKGYRVSAFDSCINQSVISQEHKPSFLNFQANYCQNKVKITWTPYIGSTVTNYSVYLRKLPGDFIIDAVLGSTSTSLSYEFTSGEQVEIFVRTTLANGFSSRSNPIFVSVLDSFNTDSNYIRSIKWDAINTFEIAAISNYGFLFDSTYLFRYRNNSTELLHIESPTKADYLYLDNKISDTLIYHYRQKLVDICERVYWSNTSNNMVLKSSVATDLNHEHIWNSYATWPNGVSHYQLQIASSPDKNSTWNTIENNLSDTFTKNILLETDTFNIRCYRIKAIEASPNPLGILSESISNPTCIIEKPLIFFPNAIHIGGQNELFEPKGVSIDKQRSKIFIYARNGQEVFSSDFTVFWDGRINSTDYVPTGVYIYIAQVYFLDNSKNTYKGNITVLH